MALLLAKGENFASWRGVEEFAVAYREAAVRLASRHHPEGMAQLLELVEDQLNGIAQENTSLRDDLDQILQGFAAATGKGQLRPLLPRFYDSAYRHFSRFSSPVAFYRMSEIFLRTLTESCLRLAKQEIGTRLPPLALVVMGPAGRREVSRYCQIQMALIWDGEVADQVMAQLGEELVAWLRVCGIVLEEPVTPQHRSWRGSLADWQDRFETASAKQDQPALIELLRLADKTILTSEADLAVRFDQLCSRQLGKRDVIGNLVRRCQQLSNGISMMGNLKLEKSGPHRGAFPLLDHALLPLAAAVAALCLLHGVEQTGTPERLRQLVRIGRLDVDLAERALHAWHCFSEHRLTLELHATPGQDCRDILHLVPSMLGVTELDRLHSSLETVADMQRFLQVSFGAYT